MGGFAQSYAGGIAIIAIASLAAVTTLLLLQRFWPPARRMAHNDVVGPSVSVIGTTYAVIIAFMLSGVWTNFLAAQVNAQQEANCLVNLYRFAERFPEKERTEVQQLAVQYSNVMVSEEWPAMEQEITSPRGRQLMEQFWMILPAIEGQTTVEHTAVDHALTELSAMTEHRRIRLLQSHESLPGILWSVLILGGIITVASTCLFGVQNFRLHLVQVVAITLLISLMLIAIADIDQPFQGVVRVSPDGFQYALESFDHWAHRSN